MARKFAVLGAPIQHSKSPAIHKAAYRFLGLDWEYDLHEINESELPTFLEVTALDGMSLTMPLKDLAYELTTTTDEAANKSKAVNTLLRTSTGWQGFNTDVFGLEKALNNVEKSNALILGSGATARNAVLALSSSPEFVSISVKSRNQDRVFALTKWAASLGIVLTPIMDTAPLGDFDLVISTLPPSSDTQDWFDGTPEGTLLDVAYSPWPSALATQWYSSGGNVVSGIEMLIWQAIAQVRVFMNGSVAEALDYEDRIAEVMRAAALAEG